MAARAMERCADNRVPRFGSVEDTERVDGLVNGWRECRPCGMVNSSSKSRLLYPSILNVDIALVLHLCRASNIACGRGSLTITPVGTLQHRIDSTLHPKTTRDRRSSWAVKSQAGPAGCLLFLNRCGGTFPLEDVRENSWLCYFEWRTRASLPS